MAGVTVTVCPHLIVVRNIMKAGMNDIKRRLVSLMLAAALIFTALPLLGTPGFSAEAASVTATGKTSVSGVCLRKSSNTSAKVIKTLKKNTKLTIHREIFKKHGSTSAKKRWYYVSVGSKKGYVRSDMVKSINYSNTAASTSDALNYRTGPSTRFKKLGTVPQGTSVTLQLPAKIAGSDDMWYRATVKGKTAYISSSYVSIVIITPPEELEGKSELARELLSHPTKGGKARVVYTFDTENCTKLFPVKGYLNATVPQGFTFTGSKYYVLYGMAAGQSIVTFAADGTRLDASKFSFCIGHPNGITWDPQTKMCYIFKGNQKTIYTWNPATGKFGKSKTPYSSSGVGYDNSTKLLYASSKTGIRAYSADGAFKHKKLFPRCDHGIFHYIQDCGAGEGFIFHGISGASKKETNFLDIYRAADSAYLGSIKITIGEFESAVVGNDGYLQLLINTSGSTDYVWRTPLNVNELK